MHNWIWLLLTFSPLAEAKLENYFYDDKTSCVCKGKIDTAKISMPWVEIILSRSLDPVFKDFESLLFLMNNEGIRGGKIENLLAKVKAEDEKAAEEALKKLRAQKLPKGKNFQAMKEHYLKLLTLEKHLRLAELDYMRTQNVEPLRMPFGKEAVPKKCLEAADLLERDASISKYYNEHLSANPQCKSQLGNAKDWKGLPCRLEMRATVLSMAWHNCVNHAWRPDEPKERDAAVKELQALFKEYKCDCTDP